MTNVEKVRALIGDKVDPQFFTDADLEEYLEIRDDDVFMAAADAAQAWGSKLAEEGTMLKSLDTQVDTRNKGKGKFDLAKALREQAENDGSFAVAEMVTEHWGYAERRRKNRQRES